MKIYYEVIEVLEDRVYLSSVLNAIQADAKPNNRMEHSNGLDRFYNYFQSYEEADKYITKVRERKGY